MNKKERTAKHVEQRLHHDLLFEVSIVTQRSSGNRFSINSPTCYSSWHTHYSSWPLLTLLMASTTINKTSWLHLCPIKSSVAPWHHHGTLVTDADESINRLFSYKFNLHYRGSEKAFWMFIVSDCHATATSKAISSHGYSHNHKYTPVTTGGSPLHNTIS